MATFTASTRCRMKARLIAAMCISFTIHPCAGQDHAPGLFEMQRVQKDSEVHPLYLLDGKLIFYTGAATASTGPVHRCTSLSRTFELQPGEGGTYLIARPTADYVATQKAATLDLDGYFLTGDYSTSMPSLKLTRAPDKYSLWEVPEEAGPIENKNDLGRRAYLSAGDAEIFLDEWTAARYFLECRKATLSYSSSDKFRLVERPASRNVDRPVIGSILTQDQTRYTSAANAICLVDGQLLASGPFSARRESSAKHFDFSERTFELRETRRGNLIILRPRASSWHVKPSRTFDLDGFFLTVGSEKQQPILKFTLAPEEGSYWKVPQTHFGPIAGNDGSGRDVYLCLEKTPEFLLDPTTGGTLKYYPVALSYQATDEFRFKRDDPRDGL